jgi:peptidoglycan/LPS O-acetylase OafA/YrhL
LGWFVWALLLVAPLARWGLFMATGKNSAFYFDTLGQMDSLAMGAGLALLKASGKLPVAWIQRWGVVLMTMPVLYYLALAGLAPNLGENQPSMIFIFTGNALFGGLLLLGLFYWAPARQLFSHPWAVWVGRYTYAMYLTHMLAIFAAEKLVKHYLGSVDTPLNWLALILLSFALVCLFAFIGWHGVEKWFQALRKSFVRVGS